MKLLITLGVLCAFMLGAIVMLGLVQLGVVDVDRGRAGSTQAERSGGGSTVEETGAGDELEGVDEADTSAEALAKCARKARGVAGAKFNPDDADLLAADALGGVVVVDWAKNRANVSFHLTETAAKNAQVDYKGFAEANGRTYDERLFRNGGVVTAFENSASEDERRAIAGCL